MSVRARGDPSATKLNKAFGQVFHDVAHVACILIHGGVRHHAQAVQFVADIGYTGDHLSYCRLMFCGRCSGENRHQSRRTLGVEIKMRAMHAVQGNFTIGRHREGQLRQRVWMDIPYQLRPRPHGCSVQIQQVSDPVGDSSHATP
jgi:hypothetical protein